MVRALLDAHAALEDKTPKGLTPLLCAAASGQTNICRMLLHRKADINAKNEKGKGALQLAAAASSHCADFLRTVAGACEVPFVKEGRDRKDPGHSKGKLGRYAVRSLDNTTIFHTQHLRYSQTPIESSGPTVRWTTDGEFGRRDGGDARPELIASCGGSISRRGVGRSSVHRSR